MMDLGHRAINYFHSKGINQTVTLSVPAIAFLVIFGTFAPELLAGLVVYIAFFFPLWGPVFFATAWWWFWVRYVRSRWLAAQKYVLLEIKIPPDVEKTPKAMEVVFNNFNVRLGATTFVTRWWHGGVGAQWTFELYSYEGTLHFYLRAPAPLKDYAEAQIYAQYPDVEIAEVPDYTSGLYPLANMQIWGVEYLLAKNDAYPIKTYIDYGLEDPDMEKYGSKVADPLAGVFERFADMGPGEQLMMQIIFRRAQTGRTTPWLWFPAGKTKWKEDAKDEIKKIYAEAKLDYENIVTGDVEKGFAQLKPGELEQVKALERSIDKLGFEVGIRLVYIGKPGAFRGHIASPEFSQMWRHFSSDHLNNLGPSGRYWYEGLDYKWEEFFGIRPQRYRFKLLDAYKRRMIFEPPYEHYRSVMTSEELATIYHFPGKHIDVPGIARIPSRRGTAPPNLPR
ncbi:MAG: hypothetical protein Q8P16_01485 [bacterium]|nr:hypothetical protein [bacterium]